jgi:MFS family permease
LIQCHYWRTISDEEQLVYYSPTLFQQLGLDYELQLTLSGVLNIAQFTAIAIAFLILDKVGRRPPLLWGAVGMAASHFIVAAMIGKCGSGWSERLADASSATYEDDWASHPTQAWVGVGFLFGFMMCYGIGWGPVPWTMRE